MTLTSVRLPESLVSSLKRRALTESLRRGVQVSWACLLREAAEGLLRQNEVLVGTESGSAQLDFQS
jgi:hypothetical protein